MTEHFSLPAARRFVVVGATHWDVIAHADRPLGPGLDAPGEISRRPGGVAFNIASHLAALGHKVALASVVSTDAPGLALVGEAERRGLDTSLFDRVATHHADGYVAIEDGAGELIAAVASVTTLQDHAAELCRIAAQGIEGAAAVLLDTNLTDEAVGILARAAWDANLPVVGTPANPATAPRLNPLIAHAGIVVANLAEAQSILGDRVASAANAAEDLCRQGAVAALITHGPNAAALAEAGEVHTLVPHPVGVHSVTGAGDALTAQYISSVAGGASAKDALAAAVEAARAHITGALDA